MQSGTGLVTFQWNALPPSSGCDSRPNKQQTQNILPFPIPFVSSHREPTQAYIHIMPSIGGVLCCCLLVASQASLKMEALYCLLPDYMAALFTISSVRTSDVTVSSVFIQDCSLTMPDVLGYDLTMRHSRSSHQILCMPSSTCTGCTRAHDAPFHTPCDTSLFHLAVFWSDYRAICWVLTATAAGYRRAGDAPCCLFVGWVSGASEASSVKQKDHTTFCCVTEMEQTLNSMKIATASVSPAFWHSLQSMFL